VGGRILIWSIGAAGVGFLALAIVLPWMVRKAMFPAPGAGAANAPSRIAGLEVVQLLDGDVEAWWMPPVPETAPRSPALIFFHGNGELIDHWVMEFQEARRMGLGVLLVEFPGYGRSGGTPSEKSVVATALEAYDYLAGRPDVDRDRIIGYGRSLGGGAVCALSRERELAALVLESTFTSAREMARGLGAPGFLVRDVFDNESAVAEFAGPILIVHGEHDRLIPVAHARRLRELSERASLVTRPCGHNDCPRLWTALRAFLAEHRLSG